MDSNARDDQAFVAALEAVPLPHADTPLFKAQLKAKLLAEAARPARVVRPVWWRYALVAAVMLVALTWQIFPAPLPAFAYLELEVNPGVRLTINRRGQVIGIEPLDDAAALALRELTTRGRTTAQVVVQVLGRLHGAALLDASSQVWLVASPIGETRAEEIAELLAGAQKAVNTETQRLLTQSPAVQNLVVDRERYEVAKQAALRPSQYARLARAGVSASGLKELVAAGARLQAAGKMTGNRLREFAELIAELVELGLPEGEATQLIETMLVKEQSMERLTKRIERTVERIEDGHALKDAVRELREGTDPSGESDEPLDEEDNDRGEDRTGGQGRGREREREDEEENKREDKREGEDEDEGDGESDDERKSDRGKGRGGEDRESEPRRGTEREGRNGLGQGPGRDDPPETGDEDQDEDEGN